MNPLASARRWLDSWNPYDPAKLAPAGTGIEPLLMDETPLRSTTQTVVVVFFLAFTVWALVAPLDSGVVVPGSVKVSGSRKAVQHPSGGVITAILVQEGSHVKQGDPLLRINPLATEANLTAASSEYVNMLATESRLLAERSGSDIRWNDELLKLGDGPNVREAKSLQSQLFRSRRSAIDSQRNALESTIASLVTVLAEKRGQLALVTQETESIIQLAKEGFVTESRANEMRRSKSSLDSDIARSVAELNSARQQLSQLRSNYSKDIETELAAIQKQREALQIKVQSLDFERNLSEVKSPATGVIVGSKVTTVGGVISSGQVLMEVVPDNATLIVDAQVPLNAIDKVYVGLETNLRFTAFNQRTTPVIPGVVKLVGADKITDPIKGEYYLTEVETTAQGIEMLRNEKIQPGMSVEVVVKNGERTFFTYITKPLSDRVARSFKE
jgi:protease secretion system membrane fusion protein